MFKARSISKNKTKRREAISSDDDAGITVPDSCVTSDLKRKRGIVDSLSEIERPQKDPISGSGREPVILAAEEALRMTATESTVGTISHSSTEHVGAERLNSTGVGPSRQSRHLRTTSSRFDYQMDICKDFKETGYCGFGDSCKFLHDRSDYKTGWELERDWDREREAKNVLPPEKTETDEKSICSACRRIWSACESQSCVTTCGHYYCEKCFLTTSMVNCAVCGISTNGIFNSV